MAKEPGSGALHPSAPTTPEEILIVDDDLDYLEILENLLGRAGYVVRLVTNGELALISLQTHGADLILLDIKMPQEDGYAVCRRIKARPATADIPIIFLSALTESFDIVKGFEIGGVDYITKPFQSEEVLARVKTHLRLRRLQRDLQAATLSSETLVRRRTAELQRANVALQQSEERYRRLTENARDVIYRMTLSDGRYEYVNAAAADIFGYTPEEFYQTPMLIEKVIHPDWEPYLREQWALLLKGEVRPEYEYQIVDRAGKTKWLRQSNVLLRDAQGRPMAIEGIVTDITDRKEAEANLVESEVRMRTLVNTIPDLVWLKDLQGIYLGCNRTFERFFGAREAEIVGKSDYDFVDRELADFFRENDRKALAADGARINEERLRFADDGYEGVFETLKTAMFDDRGRPVGVLGIARDITKHKQAQQDLRDSERRYKKAQRMGRVGNWEYDLVTQRFWGSDQAKRIYGFDPESPDFTVDEVENCIPERERVHQALEDLVERGAPYDLEFEIHPVSGPRRKIIHSVAELVRDEAGAAAKVVGVIQDITRRKAAEQALIDLERQLRHAMKIESIGTLAGGIAHDFNNILSSIIGFTELALDEVAAGSVLEDSLQEIFAAGARARELVRQILVSVRKSDEEIKPIQPGLIIKEALKFIRSSIPTSIEIRSDIVSEAYVLANPSQFHQVIMNLCTNAAQAMEAEGGVLAVRLSEVEVTDRDLPGSPGLKPGAYLSLEVSDTGGGIPADLIDRIFDPYFSTKTPGEGTGLGLAVVQGIVQSTGGKIAVRSQPGERTTFTVHLPVSQRRGAVAPYKAVPLPTGHERILLVDDEASITKIGSLILSRLGYAVTTRTSSAEALALFRQAPDDFDLVITDMTMPRMTGDRLAEEIMALRPGFPVILCTGFNRRLSDERIAEIGIKAVAYKPIVKADLAKTVRRVLDAAGREGA